MNCFQPISAQTAPTEYGREWVQMAEQGNAEAQCALGNCYMQGKGVTKDPAEAVRWYRKAADQDLPEAQNNLGYCYREGAGVDKDMSQSFYWYEKAAEQGVASAQYRVAQGYLYGQGVNEDLQKAFSWFKKAGDQGHEAALCACYYFNLRTPPKDDALESLYYKIAEKGDPLVQMMLGWWFYGGKKFDVKEAVKWFEKSAQQGNRDGKYFLSFCYERGDGVPKDPEKAFNLLIDTTNGNAGSGSMYKLGSYYKDGFGTSRDYNEALKWFRKAADRNSNDAMYALGEMYEKGLGVEKDLEEASNWYKKAADKGNYSAKRALERLNKKKEETPTPQAQTSNNTGKSREKVQQAIAKLKSLKTYKSLGESVPQVRDEREKICRTVISLVTKASAEEDNATVKHKLLQIATDMGKQESLKKMRDVDFNREPTGEANKEIDKYITRLSNIY